jgi:hypothetical protein
MTDKAKERSRGRNFRLSKFQKNKVIKLKSDAAKAKSHTWNPYFLGSNATADSLAGSMGVDKYDLVAGDGHNRLVSLFYCKISF